MARTASTSDVDLIGKIVAAAPQLHVSFDWNDPFRNANLTWVRHPSDTFSIQARDHADVPGSSRGRWVDGGRVSARGWSSWTWDSGQWRGEAHGRRGESNEDRHNRAADDKRVEPLSCTVQRDR